MPGNRRTVTLSPNEVNPFGQQAEVAPDLGLQQQESEEVVLRRTISQFPAGGLSGGEGNFSALLGPMRLRAGDRLPKILPKQSERLEVVAITEKVVILGFLEQDGKVGDRTFAVQLNTRPVVRYMLPSQSVLPPASSPLEGVYVPPGTNETP